MASAGNVYNVQGTVTGVDPLLASVRYWLWPTKADRDANVNELPATLAGFQQCHFLEFDGYDKRNASGNLLLHNWIDTSYSGWSIWQTYGVDATQQQAVENLLRAAFPAPGPD